MPGIPTPPVDGSGGFLVIRYSNGTYTHRARVHIAQFGASNPASPAIANDQSFNVAATGQEALLSATFAGIAGQMAKWYPTAWQFSLDALYQVVAGSNNPTQLFPIPACPVISGNNGNPDNPFPEAEAILNFRTAGGHRARIVLIGPAAIAPAAPISAGANSAGTLQQQMVAYLTGTATQVVGHDGTRFTGAAHVTYPYNRRLRRHYGHA